MCYASPNTAGRHGAEGCYKIPGRKGGSGAFGEASLCKVTSTMNGKPRAPRDPVRTPWGFRADHDYVTTRMLSTFEDELGF